MAIDCKEAAGDCRRIAFLRQVDETFSTCRRRGSRWRRRLGRRRRQLGGPGEAAVKTDLPPVDSVLVARDARVTPDLPGERCHDVGEPGMAVQQDPGPHVLVRTRKRDTDAFAIRSRHTQRRPGLGGIVGNQVRNGYGHALGERCLAHKGADDLASRGLEHELQLATPRQGGRFHDAHRSDVVQDRRLPIIWRSPQRNLTSATRPGAPAGKARRPADCFRGIATIRAPGCPAQGRCLPPAKTWT